MMRLSPGSFLALAGALSLVGCASIPSSGPTTGQVLKSAKHPPVEFPYRLVPIDPASVGSIVAQDLVLGATPPKLAGLSRPGRVDVILPGDVLQIEIYEVGVSLFNGQTSLNGATGSDNNIDPGLSPTAGDRLIRGVSVAQDGTVSLPYMGHVPVAGLTTAEAEQKLVHGLAGKSQSPQALVSITDSFARSVFVFGDVKSSGRLSLRQNRERLLDAIAQSGGPSAGSYDTLVRVTRDGVTATTRLAAIAPGDANDIQLLPGDRIELLRRALSYSVLGAAGKVAQVAFETDRVSLAEAVARAGGASDAQADPRAIFLFRFASPDGSGDPTIYRLDMTKPENMFLAQKIAMRDKDVLYFANAGINPVAKFITILNQLVSPAVTARVLTQ